MKLGDHAPSGNVKFPYRLCDGNHPIHLCPYLDEAKKVFDNHPTSLQRFPSGYRRLSLSSCLGHVNQNHPIHLCLYMDKEKKSVG